VPGGKKKLQTENLEGTEKGEKGKENLENSHGFIQKVFERSKPMKRGKGRGKGRVCPEISGLDGIHSNLNLREGGRGLGEVVRFHKKARGGFEFSNLNPPLEGKRKAPTTEIARCRVKMQHKGGGKKGEKH